VVALQRFLRQNIQVKRAPDSGRVSTRAIILQLVVLAGLLAFYKLYLPHLEKARAAAAAQERDRRIEALVRSLVVEDAGREVPGAEGGHVHAQKLASTPTMDEVEQTLGVPDKRTTDVRGGLHLIWVGTAHELEASFDHGHLYCLRWEDRRTGHGALVFESSWGWHAF
jgi:hypothetical protein